MRVAVISLKRTPERWSAFMLRNQNALKHCEVVRINGIDGSELLNSKIKTKLIAPSARKEWSAGAIGIGLSHRLCWRLCYNSRSPLVVLEDDVVLSDSWRLQLQQILHPGPGMMLLGWNLDSVLRAEFCHRQEMISLFEPAYPSERRLHEIVNSEEARKSKRLRYCFGLPGYWMKPTMALSLMTKIERLEALQLRMAGASRRLLPKTLMQCSTSTTTNRLK